MRRFAAPYAAIFAAPALLVAIYVATMAPSVTLWDSGEFLSAMATLGVPHPPGTPLFIFGGAAWWRVLPGVDLATAANLASVLTTAAGCTLLAHALVRGHGVAATTLAAVVAGIGGAVWQSATETEVYGWSLALSALMVWIGDRAGRLDDGSAPRYQLLLAFCFGLGVPLHLSALVAGPAAVWLAYRPDRGVSALLPLVAAWVLAMGCGLVSPAIVGAGAVLAAWAVWLAPAGHRTTPVKAALLALLGASFVLVMLVRARHDPGVNQGNPATWTALLELVGRAQYDVPGLWPRRAPFWLQLGNLVQYADWQFGFGLDSRPGASWIRTPMTAVLVLAALVGARTQWLLDRRRFLGHLLLFGAATAGVVVVLNLRAGPSYGWGVLPDGATHEARERDYFFALGMACWGLWIGLGVQRVVQSIAAWRAWRTPVCGAVVVGLVAANWAAMNRRAAPGDSVAGALGGGMLASLPPRAVLMTAGDNDSYAAWFEQTVKGRRRDVTVVTLPLLPARWYREQLRRRDDLVPLSRLEPWSGTYAMIESIAATAEEQGRPIAFSLAVPVADRSVAGRSWRFTGLAFVRDTSLSTVVPDSALLMATERAVRDAGFRAEEGGGRDPATRYVVRLLQCSSAALREREPASQALLETWCNYR